MHEGQKVVCISEKFPMIATTNKNKEPLKPCVPFNPIKGETLVIDEMMGDEWLRFDKYDTEESFNWWHSSRFKPLDDIQITFTHNEAIEFVLKS